MIWPLIRLLLLWSMPLCAAILGIVLAVRTRAFKPIVSWWVKTTLIFLLGLPITFLGLFAVAIGIPFRRVDPATKQPFTDPRFAHLGSWLLTRLPRWLLFWDNAFDGLGGDKRGWFANWCIEHGIGYPSFWAMWIWAAIRNPANYWSRVITGCDVTGCTVDVLYGSAVVDESHPGLHMLLATDAKGRKFPTVEVCYPWPIFKGHGVFGRFGWKIKTEHAGTPAGSRPQDRLKGAVYRLSLWKDLS